MCPLASRIRLCSARAGLISVCLPGCLCLSGRLAGRLVLSSVLRAVLYKRVSTNLFAFVFLCVACAEGGDSVRLVDEQTFELLDRLQLQQHELACSVCR